MEPYCLECLVKVFMLLYKVIWNKKKILYILLIIYESSAYCLPTWFDLFLNGLKYRISLKIPFPVSFVLISLRKLKI